MSCSYLSISFHHVEDMRSDLFGDHCKRKPMLLGQSAGLCTKSLYSHHFKQRPASVKANEDTKKSKERTIHWNGKNFGKPTKPQQDFDSR